MGKPSSIGFGSDGFYYDGFWSFYGHPCTHVKSTNLSQSFCRENSNLTKIGKRSVRRFFGTSLGHTWALPMLKANKPSWLQTRTCSKSCLRGVLQYRLSVSGLVGFDRFCRFQVLGRRDCLSSWISQVTSAACKALSPNKTSS